MSNETLNRSVFVYISEDVCLYHSLDLSGVRGLEISNNSHCDGSERQLHISNTIILTNNSRCRRRALFLDQALSAPGIALSVPYMSLVERKPAFCICENKDADQLRGDRDADQRLCFRYTDSTMNPSTT